MCFSHVKSYKWSMTIIMDFGDVQKSIFLVRYYSLVTIIYCYRAFIRLTKISLTLILMLTTRTLTQSIPFLKWIPTKGPLSSFSLMKRSAAKFSCSFHWKNFASARFSGWTGNAAGAPVNARTGKSSAEMEYGNLLRITV